jgi:hypothetical protein
MPVYAIIVANFCRSWNFYLLVLFQASYLKSTFHLQIQEVRWNCKCGISVKRPVCQPSVVH